MYCPNCGKRDRIMVVGGASGQINKLRCRRCNVHFVVMNFSAVFVESRDKIRWSSSDVPVGDGIENVACQSVFEIELRHAHEFLNECSTMSSWPFIRELVERLEKVLDIKDQQEFDRNYGEYQ